MQAKLCLRPMATRSADLGMLAEQLFAASCINSQIGAFSPQTMR